ncbi:MAG TPA: hypothetical protein VF316_10445, partial [Polyangiaceae bacterium]
ADSQRDALVSSNGSFVIGWRERRWGIFLSEDGGYGFENFATLRYAPVDPLPGAPPGQPATPTPTQTLPGTNTLTTISSRSALSAYQLPRDRWLISEAAAFELAGGATTAAQAFLPRFYGPHANVAADWRFAHVDHIGVVADATYQIFSLGNDIGLGTAELRYRHDLAPHSSFTLSAGPAAATIRTRANDTQVTHPYVTASAGVSYRRGFLGTQLTVDAIARFTPVVDRIAAVVDPRVSVAVDTTWATHRLVLLLGVSGVQSTSLDVASPAITFVGANATVRVPVATTVDLEAGSRAALQRFAGAVFASYGFFFAVDLHAPVLHFRTE